MREVLVMAGRVELLSTRKLGRNGDTGIWQYFPEKAVGPEALGRMKRVSYLESISART